MHKQFYMVETVSWVGDSHSFTCVFCWQQHFQSLAGSNIWLHIDFWPPEDRKSVPKLICWGVVAKRLSWEPNHSNINLPRNCCFLSPLECWSKVHWCWRSSSSVHWLQRDKHGMGFSTLNIECWETSVVFTKQTKDLEEDGCNQRDEWVKRSKMLTAVEKCCFEHCL